jgi:hypothetical protein
VFWNNRRSFDVFRLDRMNLISRLTPDEIAISSLAAIVIVRARFGGPGACRNEPRGRRGFGAFCDTLQKINSMCGAPIVRLAGVPPHGLRTRQTEQAALGLSHKPKRES